MCVIRRLIGGLFLPVGFIVAIWVGFALNWKKSFRTLKWIFRISLKIILTGKRSGTSLLPPDIMEELGFKKTGGLK